MMMKMMMFLLVSSVALLLSPAATRPTEVDYRNNIIELVDKYNTSLTEAVYVEDVSNLGCEDKFFCKVHNILHNCTQFGERLEERRIVKTVEMLNKVKNRSCSKLLQEETFSGVESPIPALLGRLTYCLKKNNLTPPRDHLNL